MNKEKQEHEPDKLDHRKKRLEDVQEAIKYYELEKMDNLREIERIERMAENGEIGFDEYEALMSNYTKGMHKSHASRYYDDAIMRYKEMEKGLKAEVQESEIQKLEKLLFSPRKEHGKINYGFFAILVFAIAITTMISLSMVNPGSGITGYAVQSSDLTQAEPVSFMGAMLLITFVFIIVPILVVFAMKILEIFKNRP